MLYVAQWLGLKLRPCPAYMAGGAGATLPQSWSNSLGYAMAALVWLIAALALQCTAVVVCSRIVYTRPCKAVLILTLDREPSQNRAHTGQSTLWKAWARLWWCVILPEAGMPHRLPLVASRDGNIAPDGALQGLSCFRQTCTNTVKIDRSRQDSFLTGAGQLCCH